MKLLKCPFCGGKAEVRREYGYGGQSSKIFTLCTKCGAKSLEKRVVDAEGPAAAIAAIDEVTELWNRRK